MCRSTPRIHPIECRRSWQMRAPLFCSPRVAWSRRHLPCWAGCSSWRTPSPAPWPPGTSAGDRSLAGSSCVRRLHVWDEGAAEGCRPDPPWPRRLRAVAAAGPCAAGAAGVPPHRIVRVLVVCTAAGSAAGPRRPGRHRNPRPACISRRSPHLRSRERGGRTGPRPLLPAGSRVGASAP